MTALATGKILVIRGGAIGDFILTLPVLAALRAQFPQVRLEVLGYAHIGQLALVGGLADAVRSIESASLAGFFARGGALAPELEEYFAGFSIIISYLYDPDGIFEANVKRCSKAQFLAGPHRPAEKGGLHASKVFLAPLVRLAIFDADDVPRLRLSFPELGAGSDWGEMEGGKWLMLHPGSGSESKNWPESKWAELLHCLVEESDWSLFLVSGEAEVGRLERLTKSLPSRRYRTAHGRPLAELAEGMRMCQAFVGHDSGISHLASALGVAGVVLWAGTEERVWRPPQEEVTVLREGGGIGAITVERVMEQLRCLGESSGKQ